MIVRAAILGGAVLIGAVAVWQPLVGRFAHIARLEVAEALAAPRRPPRAKPESAEAFADSVGVVVHLVYADSAYANWPHVKASLDWLGVKHLREIAPLPGNARIEHVHAAAEEGFRFTFLVLGQVPLADSVAALSAFERAHPGAVAAIEGPNEVNNFGFAYKGRRGDDAAQIFQSDLFDAVRGSPALTHVPVYNLTSWPDLAGKADFANFHSYAHAGAQARATLLGDMARQQVVMPGKPMVLTEAGYHNTIDAGLWEGVDETTAAPLMLNLLFDAWAAGVSETMLYQLLDGYPDPGGKDMERHFGLFDNAYRPKPAAHALRNLLIAMRDSGTAGVQLGEARLLRGPEDIALLQLSRADGARIAVLYRRAPLWDPDRDSPIAVADAQVSLSAPPGAGEAAIHAPVTGSRTRAGLANGTVTLPLGAAPLIVVFRAKH